MDEAYRQAMQEQLAQLQEEFQEIRDLIASQGFLPNLIYRAAERNLQLLVEACIGIAKQTLKSEGLEVPSDTRQTFAKLKSKGLDPTETPWTKIIGMRNALVHHYLNLDPERILQVIRSSQYQLLFDFAQLRLESGKTHQTTSHGAAQQSTT